MQSDRWLFYFEGRAAGGDASAARDALAYLEAASLEIEREVVREIRRALPGDADGEIDLRFATDGVVWFGAANVYCGADPGLSGDDFTRMLERLVCYAIDRVIQDYAGHFGFHAIRTRPRGLPRHAASAPLGSRAPVEPGASSEPRAPSERRASSAPAASPVATPDVLLETLDERFAALGRSVRLGFAAVLLLIAALVAAVAWNHVLPHDPRAGGVVRPASDSAGSY